MGTVVVTVAATGRGGMPGARPWFVPTAKRGTPYRTTMCTSAYPMAPKIVSTRSEADRVDRVEKLRENIPIPAKSEFEPVVLEPSLPQQTPHQSVGASCSCGAASAASSCWQRALSAVRAHFARGEPYGDVSSLCTCPSARMAAWRGCCGWRVIPASG